MTKGELIRAAAEATGQRIPAHRLSYCVDNGHIDRPVKRAGSYWLYEEKHLQQFIEYLRRASEKRAMSQA